MVSTNIERWEKECLTKKRYYTHDRAEEVCKRRTEEGGTQLYTYRCDSCGEWHLTRQPISYRRYKFLRVV